jgi:hypothetical protein
MFDNLRQYVKLTLSQNKTLPKIVIYAILVIETTHIPTVLGCLVSKIHFLRMSRNPPFRIGW